MEIWKDIPSYEGFYQASTMGRVRSMSHSTNNSYCVGKIRKPRYDKNGYAILNLCKDGNVKTCKVHRLIAITFIDNPNNYHEIDHINTIKYDNRPENLRWCTTQQNTQYREEHYEIGDRAKYKVLCKETSKTYSSSYDAAFWVINNCKTITTNYKSVSKAIRANCVGKVKSSYGFHWAYIEGSTTRADARRETEMVSSTLGG